MTSFKTMTKKMKRKIILNLNHLMMSKTVKVLNNNKEERRKKLRKRTWIDKSSWKEKDKSREEEKKLELKQNHENKEKDQEINKRIIRMRKNRIKRKK